MISLVVPELGDVCPRYEESGSEIIDRYMFFDYSAEIKCSAFFSVCECLVLCVHRRINHAVQFSFSDICSSILAFRLCRLTLFSSITIEELLTVINQTSSKTADAMAATRSI